MNKTDIKNFAIWARNKLIADIQYRAGLMGITADGIKDPLPQSTGTMEFYDIGTAEPYAITGDAIPQRKKLVEVIRKKEKDSNYATAYKYILEEVAYTWFNRLIAIRFMEVNDYLPSRIRVLSSESGKIEPDLVTTPFDAELAFTPAEEETVLRLKTENKLDELFRLLFIKQCNALNEILPALFEKTNDYTELLLNLSVVDQEGVVYHLTHDIPEQDFDITHPDEDGKIQGQVEIIGWLYQYYNTEPKNAAFAKNGKITKEEIPAVTQLFTPDWIVRYMVENSLGRIFIDKRKEQGVFADGRAPEEMTWDEIEKKRISNEEFIAEQMGWKYYLPEAAQTKEVRQQLEEIQKQSEYKDVRDIKVIDPCMGSGHILVYAFDVLMKMYENDGYSQRDAAQCILENNLYGLDIDERAAQLAYFAVMMKARQYDRRIFSRGIQPHVYAIAESNDIDAYTRDYFVNNDPTLKAALDSIMNDLRDAKEYGSILTVAPVDFAALFARAEEVQNDISLYRESAVNTILPLIRVAEVLSQQYDVVVTNPPYMGSSNMSDRLSEYIKRKYPNGKTDLFASFIYRCYLLVNKNGFVAMITQHGWMFLSSYEKMRQDIIQTADLVNMAHLGAHAFDEISGEVVQTAAFVFRHRVNDKYFSRFLRLVDGSSESDKEHLFLEHEQVEYLMQAKTLGAIPNHLFAYWLDNTLIEHLVNDNKIAHYAVAKQGLITSDNDRFLRFWYEIETRKIGTKWFRYNKGGGFRRWYGNILYVVNWESDGFEICHFVDERGKLKSRPQNIQYFFKNGLTWNDVSTAKFCCRYVDDTCAFDASGPMLFVKEDETLMYFLGLLNSSVVQEFMNLICQGLHYSTGHIPQIPVIISHKSEVEELVKENISIVKADWDSFETSSDFSKHPLV